MPIKFRRKHSTVVKYGVQKRGTAMYVDTSTFIVAMETARKVISTCRKHSRKVNQTLGYIRLKLVRNASKIGGVPKFMSWQSNMCYLSWVCGRLLKEICYLKSLTPVQELTGISQTYIKPRWWPLES